MAEINFNCPHCGQNLSAPDDMAGQALDCPACNKPILIPSAIREPTPTPPAASEPFPSFVTPLAGEVLLAVTRPSRLYFLGSFIFGILLLLIGIGSSVDAKSDSPFTAIAFLVLAFAVVYMLRTIIKMLIYVYSHLFVMTNFRVLSKKGLISISTSEVRIADIRGANLRQGILERILNVGSIAIGSAATAGTEIVIVGIRNPRGILSLINSQRKA